MNPALSAPARRAAEPRYGTCLAGPLDARLPRPRDVPSRRPASAPGDRRTRSAPQKANERSLAVAFRETSFATGTRSDGAPREAVVQPLQPTRCAMQRELVTPTRVRPPPPPVVEQ